MAVATAGYVETAQTVLEYGPFLRRLTGRDGGFQAPVRVSLNSFRSINHAHVLVEIMPLDESIPELSPIGSGNVSLDYDQSSIVQIVQVWQLWEFLSKALLVDQEEFALGTLAAAEQAAGAWLNPKDSAAVDPLIQIIGVNAVGEVADKTIPPKVARNLFRPRSKVDPSDYFMEATAFVDSQTKDYPTQVQWGVEILGGVSIALSGGLERLSRGLVLGTGMMKWWPGEGRAQNWGPGVSQAVGKQAVEWVYSKNLLDDWSPYLKAPKPTPYDFRRMIQNFAQFEFPNP